MSSGKVAGLYGRVSTEEQELGGQLARLEEWADRQGFEARTWVDKASGKDPDRPGQKELMGEAMGRRVQVVAVAKIDRWARSVSHLATSVERLHDRGVEFVAVDQGLWVKPGDPTGELILTVLGAVAQWEGSIISERTKEALAHKKEKGEHVGRPTKDCFCCGAERPPGKAFKARVNGKKRPVCGGCREARPALRQARRRNLIAKKHGRDA